MPEQMTKKERVRASLAGQPVDRPPVALWGHDFLREWTAADLVANTLDAWRPYRWDFIKFNPRATYFAEAWGNTYEPPSEHRQPAPRSNVVKSAADLRAVRPIPATEGVFAEHLQALRAVIDAEGTQVDVLQTIFSPLSVVAMLCGAPPAFIEYAGADPKAAHSAIDAASETLASYARASLDGGAAGIFYAPLTWASRDTANEEFYTEFGRPYDLRVLAAAEDAPFNVLHVCRNNNMLGTLLDYPVAAFNWADHGAGNPSLQDIRARTSKA